MLTRAANRDAKGIRPHGTRPMRGRRRRDRGGGRARPAMTGGSCARRRAGSFVWGPGKPSPRAPGHGGGPEPVSPGEAQPREESSAAGSGAEGSRSRRPLRGDGRAEKPRRTGRAAPFPRRPPARDPPGLWFRRVPPRSTEAPFPGLCCERLTQGRCSPRRCPRSEVDPASGRLGDPPPRGVLRDETQLRVAYMRCSTYRRGFLALTGQWRIVHGRILTSVVG